jgi:fructose-1,6-bisphosphatase II
MRVTGAAALAAGRWAGKGDKGGGDKSAVDQMRLLLASVPFRGVVIIDEAEKDEAPMLHNCEAVGAGTGPEFDVAVDPVDGTTLLAKGMPDALPMIAIAERGPCSTPRTSLHGQDRRRSWGVRGATSACGGEQR